MSSRMPLICRSFGACRVVTELMCIKCSVRPSRAVRQTSRTDEILSQEPPTCECHMDHQGSSRRWRRRYGRQYPGRPHAQHAQAKALCPILAARAADQFKDTLRRPGDAIWLSIFDTWCPGSIMRIMGPARAGRSSGEMFDSRKAPSDRGLNDLLARRRRHAPP
jgi:hypothetical protein